jgi:hypothetical protein
VVCDIEFTGLGRRLRVQGDSTGYATLCKHFWRRSAVFVRALTNKRITDFIEFWIANFDVGGIDHEVGIESYWPAWTWHAG